MSTASRLLRDDLRDFAGYSSARSGKPVGDIWLNANESAWRNSADVEGACRRYPEPQQPALRVALAELYGIVVEQLLVGRGSDEGIDLLLRAFCAPGKGRIVITPPVFGMYAFCARLQAASVTEVPLIDGETGFALDADAVVDAALANDASLVFLCNPGNPTGNTIPTQIIAAIARRLAGRCLLVVDEAYGEFSGDASAITLLPAHDNLVALRTLSKAHGMAAVRIGSVIASAELIAMLRRVQAPYPLPQPCVELALAALAEHALIQTRARIATARDERSHLFAALCGLPIVRRVYPSAGNFVLVRFIDAQAVFARLLAAGIVVRDMRAMPQLGDALRISIGTPEQNAVVIATIAACVKEAV